MNPQQIREIAEVAFKRQFGDIEVVSINIRQRLDFKDGPIVDVNIIYADESGQGIGRGFSRVRTEVVGKILREGKDDLGYPLVHLIAETDIAVDLAQTVAGRCRTEYLDRARSSAQRYPAQGLRNLISNVGRYLTGAGGEAAALFRLDTSYGGGKTPGPISLVDAARRMRSVANVAKFRGQILVLFVSAILVGCIGGNAHSINGDADGGDGVAVQVYNSPEPGYITPATTCVTPIVSCRMGEIIPRGSDCYCPSPSGPIWGRSH